MPLKTNILLLSIFLLFIGQISFAQENLVPNGSFEEYNNCPDYDNGFYIDACKYWTAPTLGSPDYFNRCSTFWDILLNRYLFSVPENYIGYQEARTGDGYAGIIFGQGEETGQPYSEYIQVKLKTQLIKDNFYHLRFFVSYSGNSHSENGFTCVNSMGALFTNNELHENHDSIIQMTPQFQSDLNMFFCDTTKWYELDYTFQAEGDENYLTIGVFTPKPFIKITNLQGDVQDNEVTPYYYIDDVSVIEVGDLSKIKDKIPNIFTPNNDGANDIFTLNKLGLEPQSVTIINRWGNCVYQSENTYSWDGTYQGKKCSDGVYFYVIEFAKGIKINGFVHLIR